MGDKLKNPASMLKSIKLKHYMYMHELTKNQITKIELQDGLKGTNRNSIKITRARA